LSVWVLVRPLSNFVFRLVCWKKNMTGGKICKDIRKMQNLSKYEGEKLNSERICDSPNIFCFDFVVFLIHFIFTIFNHKIKFWHLHRPTTLVEFEFICLVRIAPKKPSIRFYNHIFNVLRRGFRVAGSLVLFWLSVKNSCH